MNSLLLEGDIEAENRATLKRTTIDGVFLKED